ncbi:MMPL family transporter [Coprobacillaceae bacterium CR2/5/TPMF4]|nr:MMPL family transporter [Coprobacillaceae bacterium CR2/5/TPMF4]
MAIIAVIVVFIILFLTTTSWADPIIFMLTIGIAVLINRGTNILLGEISFVSNAAGSILQLAVSMDYSIF